MVLFRGHEVQEILANQVVNRLLLQQQQVRLPSTRLPRRYLTKMTEVLSRPLRQTIINLLKGLRKVKIIDLRLRSKSHKITLHQRLLISEVIPLMYLITEFYFQMRLQGLKKPMDV